MTMDYICTHNSVCLLEVFTYVCLCACISSDAGPAQGVVVQGANSDLHISGECHSDGVGENGAGQHGTDQSEHHWTGVVHGWSLEFGWRRASWDWWCSWFES